MYQGFRPHFRLSSAFVEHGSPDRTGSLGYDETMPTTIAYSRFPVGRPRLFLVSGRAASPIPGFRSDGLAYSRFPVGRPRLFQVSGRTTSPIPSFPAGGFAYSRFPGRNERHRAGIGREPWNPHERKNESPCSPWYRGRAHLPHQVFRPIPLPHEVSRPTPPCCTTELR